MIRASTLGIITDTLLVRSVNVLIEKRWSMAKLLDLDDLPDVVKIEKRVINILVLENSLCLVVIVVLLEGTKEKVRVGTAYLAPENDVSNRILSEIHRIA